MFKIMSSMILLSLLAIACGKSSSKKSIPTTVETIRGLKVDQETLSFVSDCSLMEMKEGERNWTTHKLTLKLQDGETKFDWTYVFYTPNCKTAILEGSFTGAGTFEDNDNKRMLATLSEAKMTTLHYQATASFNKTNACDLYSWTTNVSQDVIHTSCVKSLKNDFYFDSQGEELLFYSCDENEVLGSGCEKIRFHQ
jgi:hypothetical protein